MRYENWSPTTFDRRGAFLPERKDWLVAPVIQTRDSGPLEQSNFAVALDILGGESERTEVHRFGHWGPGWFEIILAHPSLSDTVDEIQESLDHYPILDESDYGEREWEAAHDAWERMGLADRIEACQRYRVSPFAARRQDVPSDPSGELISYLASP